MRLGLIARADSRGLGIQTHAVYRHLKPAKTMVIDCPSANPLPIRRDWYPDATWIHGLPTARDFRTWLQDLDVVYTAETGYGPHLWDEAERAGVRTVLHVNPEFLDVRDRPTLWAAPTAWRYSELPAPKRLLPVPITLSPERARPTTAATRFLHVIGRPAVHDRNGTLTLLEALRYVQTPITLTITCQSPSYVADALLGVHAPAHVQLDVRTGDIADHRDLYTDQHVLVLPRRFGGLCLKDTSQVVMADKTRKAIRDVEVGEQVLDAFGATTVYAKATRTVEETVSIQICGLEIVSSTDHRHLVVPASSGPKKPRITPARLQQMKAEEVRVGDWMLVKQPPPQGITKVHMGKKPKRKSLSFWPESVDLDEGWARLIGLWLAEGHSGLYPRKGRNHGLATVMWSFGPEERYLAEEVVDLLGDRGIHATIKVLNTEGSRGFVDGKEIVGTGVSMYSVRCRTLWLYELFERLGLGHGAHHKRAPDLDVSLVPALVGGWLDGDGCRSKSRTRVVEGFSRSTAMIRDMWRLSAKAGVFGRIYTNGQRLVFGGDDEVIVANWTVRLKNVPHPVGKRSPHVRNYKRCESGWMAAVNRVQTVRGSVDVVAIETVSGRYIADDILTHNCLPAQEAIGAGMPVIMPAISPNDAWLSARWLVPAEPCGAFTAKVPVQMYAANTVALAERIDQFATDATFYADSAEMAGYLARLGSWDSMTWIYEKVFAELRKGA